MSERLTPILCGDAVLAIAAVYTAVVVCLGYRPLCQEWTSIELIFSLIFAICQLFASYLMEVYSLEKSYSKLEVSINCFQSSVVALLLLTLIYQLAPPWLLGDPPILRSVIIFLIYQVVWHALSFHAINSPYLLQRVLILGNGPLALQLGDLILAGNTRFTLAGYFLCHPQDRAVEPIPDELCVPMEQDLVTTALAVKANIIVVALSEKRGVLPLQEMVQCKLEGIKVVDGPTFYEMASRKLLLEEITPGYIIFSAGFERTRIIRILKRGGDLLLSFLGLLIAAPFFPLIALAIKLDSPGPVFFKQIRVGSGERTFTLYKFRSMRDDAERDGAVWAAKGDGRVTRLGRFLRVFRIDELPQLYNVLKGDMSFIGPRPERPEFVEQLKKEISYYSKRHTIKPGLTGWAQVRFPYGASAEDALEKLRYDLYYIKNLSMFLDSQILLETVKVVVYGRGGR